MIKAKTIIKITLHLCSLSAIGQTNWTDRIKDPYYHETLKNGLHIGDAMPNLDFGDILNNKTGARRFSELKGKLIILDFWASFCAPCIAGFSKREKIQQKFGNKVQVILVNPFETEATVKARLPKFKFPDLPSIMKDENGNIDKLIELFPLRSLGHQVWINEKGIVILRGSHQNTTEEKINDYLEGKKIFILNDDAMAPKFDPSISYLNLVGNFKTTPVKVGTIITPYNNEYEAENNASITKIIDSVAGTIRNTFVNQDIITLYSEIYKDLLLQNKRNILFGPINISAITFIGFRHLVIPKDTIRYTNIFLNGNDNDSTFLTSKICYEQILPLSTSEDEQRKYMLEDLSRYLGNMYGTKVHVEKRVVKCYILKRTSEIDKLAAKKQIPPTTISTVKNGRKYIKYEGTFLKKIGNLIESNKKLSDYFYWNFKNGTPIYLLNETEFSATKRIDLEIPDGDIQSMEEYRLLLNKYDLDLIIEERSYDFVVVEDAKSNS